MAAQNEDKGRLTIPKLDIYGDWLGHLFFEENHWCFVPPSRQIEG